MKVYFKRMAFIEGVRYRAGSNDYSGELRFLPSDAVVDGKLVKDLKEAELKRAQKAAAKEEAKDVQDERKEADENRNDIVDGSGNKVGEVDETEVDAARVANERQPIPPPAKSAKSSDMDPFSGPAKK